MLELDVDDVQRNLPAELTRLVGRERELQELQAVLATTRLLTLVGVGGAGKSRLALALAGSLDVTSRHAELGAVHDLELLPQAVAVALGLGEVPPGDLPSVAARRLQRPELLVLDNCEHVAGACAALASRLLAACPALTIVATSRHVLGLAGERVMRVPGLQPPEAAALFLERARFAAPSFDPAPATLHGVEQLCRRLDGLPLAIELAAARVRLLPVHEIGVRIERDLSFLRQQSAPRRADHRTLQATLDFSHGLLTGCEAVLLRRLAAFDASFGLPAAEAVGAGGELEADEVLDVLAGLVDKSLVAIEERRPEIRYRLPATVRQDAAARLEASGEAAAVHAAHARFQLERLEQGDAESDAWCRGVEVEHDELRAALRRSLTAAPELAGRIACLLWPFWRRRGRYAEARMWLDRALEVASEVPPQVEADLWAAAGTVAFLQCDYAQATERLVEARRRSALLGDATGERAALQRLGCVARERGDHAQARRLHERCLALAGEHADAQGVAESLHLLAFAGWLDGDGPAAVDLAGEALRGLRQHGTRLLEASALVTLGAARLYAGDAAGAEQTLREALENARQLGFEEGTAWALHELGILARRRGDLPAAAELLRESVVLHHRVGDRWRTASVIEEIACGLVAGVEPGRAAELLGLTQRLRAEIGAPVPPAERRDLREGLRRIAETLDRPARRAALQSGRALTLDAAVEEAARLAARAPVLAAAQEAGSLALTGRERAVLRLIGDGLTNREIGSRLYISPSTAGVHVSNILRKLGVRRRVEAAGIAHRLALASSV